MEIWKDVPEMEGFYQVSNKGRIKALDRVVKRKTKGDLCIKEHYVQGSKDSKGYLQLDARVNGKRIIKFIHRLVAEAFIDNPQHYNQVNHKDGNKLNNDVDNLEWLSCIDNIRHAWKHKLAKPLQGENHGNHKLTNEQVLFIKTHYKKGDSLYGAKALAKRFNVTTTPILLVAKGLSWKHITI
jgi:hypothetical protein